MTKNRRSTASGYSRGDDTRARVISSALKLFGQRGFEGASTRDIAKAADVNAPALQYYFDSKEGLYVACAECMAARLWSCAGDAVARAQTLLAKRTGREALIDAFCAIQDGVADFIFSSKEPADWLLLIVRGQAGLGPDAGFRVMYNEISAKLLEVQSGIVGRFMRLPAGSDEARLRAAMLNGQLLVFLFLRRTLLTALDWREFHAAGIASIKLILRQNTADLLRAMSAAKARRLGPRRGSQGVSSDELRARTPAQKRSRIASR